MLHCDKTEDLTTDPDAHSQEPMQSHNWDMNQKPACLLTMIIIFLAQPAQLSSWPNLKKLSWPENSCLYRVDS